MLRVGRQDGKQALIGDLAPLFERWSRGNAGTFIWRVVLALTVGVGSTTRTAGDGVGIGAWVTVRSREGPRLASHPIAGCTGGSTSGASEG